MRPAPVQLLLIPGLACDATVWAPQLAYFASQPAITVHVARLDVQGSTQAMAQDLLRRYPGLLAVAGFSLGGYVAQEMALQAPQRLQALALLSTQAGTDPPAMADVRAGWTRTARQEGMAAMTPVFLDKLASAGYLADSTHRHALQAMIERHPVDAFCAEQEAIRTRRDCSQAVARLQGPTLAVIPADDALVPVANQHGMARACGMKTVLEVPGCGHTVMLEAPQVVNAAMQAWIEQATATPSPPSV